MPFFAISRRIALLFALLAFAAPVVASSAPPDPARFVAAIYAGGKEGEVWSQWLDGARRGAWFSRSLTALWAKCDAKTPSGEEGAIDFDVATNSQGMDVKSFTVKTLLKDAMRATVVATLVRTKYNWLRHSQRENEIRYDLVFEGGRWAIDDIHSVAEPHEWSRDLITRCR